MRKYLFIWLFLPFLLYAQEPLITKKAPLSVALPLLKSIDQHAIILGEGKIHMFVFIDPKCPRSQEFLTMVNSNPNSQSSYQYHFFFYEIKRLHSAQVIASIYADKDPLSAMKSFMIDKKEITLHDEQSKTIEAKINEIAEVAQKLNINKRPYLFIVKEMNNVL